MHPYCLQSNRLSSQALYSLNWPRTSLFHLVAPKLVYEDEEEEYEGEDGGDEVEDRDEDREEGGDYDGEDK